MQPTSTWLRGRTTAEPGLVLGHEITGQIVETGGDAEMVGVGDSQIHFTWPAEPRTVGGATLAAATRLVADLVAGGSVEYGYGRIVLASLTVVTTEIHGHREAAGHAAATAHVVSHALHAAAYAVKAVEAAGTERDWQYRRLPEHLRPVAFLGYQVSDFDH